MMPIHKDKFTSEDIKESNLIINDESPYLFIKLAKRGFDFTSLTEGTNILQYCGSHKYQQNFLLITNIFSAIVNSRK